MRHILITGRVGVGKSPYVESYVTSTDVGDTVPPLASKLTVYTLAVQHG